MNVTKIHALMNINGSRQKLTEAPKSIKKKAIRTVNNGAVKSGCRSGIQRPVLLRV